MVQEARAITLELRTVKQMQEAKEGTLDQRNCRRIWTMQRDLARPGLSSKAQDENQRPAKIIRGGH